MTYVFFRADGKCIMTCRIIKNEQLFNKIHMKYELMTPLKLDKFQKSVVKSMTYKSVIIEWE